MINRLRNSWRAPALAGLIARLLYPWYGHGFRHMDEHWQVIEPANHLIHGAWSIAWEWKQGDRSWIYPWLVSLPMRLAEALGLHDPIWIIAFTRMIHGLLSALAVPLVYFSVDKLTAGKARGWALAAAWFTALWPLAIYSGTHTQGDLAGALFVAAGFALPVLFDAAEGSSRSDLAYLLSGASFGVALALKIDLAVAGGAFGLWQLLRGRFRQAWLLAAGVAPLILLVGYVDLVTWGSWFHSVTSHARSNLVEGVGNQWGTSPWYMHVAYFFDVSGVFTLAAAAVLPFVWRELSPRLRAGWFLSAVFVAAYASIPHKEKRFLIPLLYVGIIVGFATYAQFSRRVSRRWQRWVLPLATLVLAVHFTANTVTYLVRRPWWDRIEAMKLAGEVPGIQKMFSPEWPAIFYLPRGVASEAIDADENTLRAKTAGLHDVSFALDWSDLTPLTQLGFKCEIWSPGVSVAPSRENAQPTPRAYHCTR